MATAGAEGRTVRRRLERDPRVAWIGLKVGAQRPHEAENRSQTRIPIDRGLAEEQVFEHRPSLSGGYRLSRWPSQTHPQSPPT